MKKKVVILSLAAALVLLIGSASLLYRSLSAQVDTDQLATQPPSAQEPPSSQESPSASDPDTSGDEAETPTTLTAPNFTVYAPDDSPVELHSFFGKPIVVNFWASWCGPCQMEMPDFNAKYLELNGDVHFLMVNMTTGQETKETASAFIEEKGYTFPVFFDLAGDAAMTYGASSLPTTYFIDAKGNAVARAVGAIDAETLQRGIDMILPHE